MRTELPAPPFRPTTPAARATPLALPRRLLGAVLILLPLLPFHRLLATPRTGLAGQSTVVTMAVYGDLIVSGLLLVVPVALLAALLPVDLTAFGRSLVLRTCRLSDRRFAVLLALVSGALTLAFTLVVLDGKPNAVDSLVQVLHARFWADGRWAGPTDGAEFWTMQNAVFTARGWVSQYPPGHVAVLALALVAGALPLTGALLVGTTVFCGARFASRLVGGATARCAGVLLALCPFFVMLGGSYMNHVTAAAFVTAGAYALLRAWQGRSRWALLAGLAFGYALCTRPLSSAAMAAALACTLPFVLSVRPPLRKFTSVVLLLAAGAVPLLAGLALYNAYFFGHPLRMGYDVALGPSMRLGFGQDPWGNVYGVSEALAWTAADLRALSVNLFEAPLPAVAIIGAFLLVAPRLSAATRVLTAWALAPVAANALYWHHSILMGPRMLHESAPAWALLFAVAVAGLLRVLPADARVLNRLRPRNALAGATAFSLALGLLLLAPQRAASYGGDFQGITRIPAPQMQEPALVFVHDAWAGRVAMTLAARGYRLDQVETLLRQNSTCDVDRLAHVAASGDVATARALYAALDTLPRAVGLPPSVAIAPGDYVRAWPGERFTAECERQARSDRFGILDVAPFTWQGDLPGGTARGALFVRDLGPVHNAALLRQHAERVPFVYTYTAAAAPRLLPYAEAMTLLWSAEP